VVVGVVGVGWVVVLVLGVWVGWGLVVLGVLLVVFYSEGYTVMEMEAGPYLSAVYETVSPNRHPQDEIVSLGDQIDFDLGIIHYASDTPYSRRQSLLSKSLSYFGVESTYGCAIAIARRILSQEVARIDRTRRYQ
jgi:hypothetical protein